MIFETLPIRVHATGRSNEVNLHEMRTKSLFAGEVRVTRTNRAKYPARFSVVASAPQKVSEMGSCFEVVFREEVGLHASQRAC